MLPCESKKCGYRGSIPGDAHIKCQFDWLKNKKLDEIPDCQSEHARKWFMFPFNFDPVWGPDKCPAFAEKSDEKMIAEANPLGALIGILGERMFK